MALVQIRLDDGLMATLQQLAQQQQTSLERLLEQAVHAYAEQEVTQPKVRTARILGLHDHLPGYWMADDFDTELPESFWLGEA